MSIAIISAVIIVINHEVIISVISNCIEMFSTFIIIVIVIIISIIMLALLVLQLL